MSGKENRAVCSPKIKNPKINGLEFIMPLLHEYKCRCCNKNKTKSKRMGAMACDYPHVIPDFLAIFS